MAKAEEEIMAKACSLHELSFLSTRKNPHRCLSVGTSVRATGGFSHS